MTGLESDQVLTLELIAFIFSVFSPQNNPRPVPICRDFVNTCIMHLKRKSLISFSNYSRQANPCNHLFMTKDDTSIHQHLENKELDVRSWTANFEADCRRKF